MNKVKERFVANVNLGALFNESNLLIDEYLRVRSMERLRERAVVDNILGKSSRATIEKALFAVNYRYLRLNSRNSPFIMTPFLKMMQMSKDNLVKKLIMYYNFCISDKLVYSITTRLLFDRLSKGCLCISKIDIEEYLSLLETSHKEILTWTFQNRQKLIRSYLTALKDFGILTGHYRKEFSRSYVPPNVFFYVLYNLKDRGLSRDEILDSEDWKVLMLDASDVNLLLNEGNKLGYVKYEAKGSIRGVEFTFKSSEEFVDEITRM